MDGPPKQSEKAWPQGQPQPVPKGHPRSTEQAGDSFMHRGWVKLWRCWADHDVARDPKASHLLNHLVIAAQHEPRVNRRFGYTVARGQCDLTQGQLADKSGLTRQEVREAVTRLLRYQTIKVEALPNQPRNRQRNLITLVNFDKYNAPPVIDNQPHNPPSNHLATSEQPPSNQALRSEEVKNEKNKDSHDADKPRRRSWAGDWEPTLQKLLLQVGTIGERCKLLNHASAIAGREPFEALLRELEGKQWTAQDCGHAYAYFTSVLKSKVAPGAQSKVSAKYQRGDDAYGN